VCSAILGTAHVLRKVLMYDTITSGTRHVNKERRHNLKTHVHAGTTPILRLLATSKTRHIVLSEDGPIGLKHVGEKK